MPTKTKICFAMSRNRIRGGLGVVDQTRSERNGASPDIAITKLGSADVTSLTY
jgi:hypothetical protein